VIEEYEKGRYWLTCDVCGEHDDSETFFSSFEEAVAYKKDRSNGWRSVKALGENGYWQELCPSCNNPETVAKVRRCE
jgi:hypothetical protein